MNKMEIYIASTHIEFMQNEQRSRASHIFPPSFSRRISSFGLIFVNCVIVDFCHQAYDCHLSLNHRRRVVDSILHIRLITINVGRKPRRHLFTNIYTNLELGDDRFCVLLLFAIYHPSYTSIM